MRDTALKILRRTERYTHLDMVYFTSGGFWQTFGGVGSNLFAFLLILVFANFLPKETYGTYRYLIALAGLLNIFTLTGMSEAVAQATAVGREGALRTAVGYQLKWNSLLMLVFLTLGGYYLLRENYALTGGLLVLGLTVPFINAFNTYGAYLVGRREFRLNNIFGVFSSFVYTLGMLAAIFWSGEVFFLVLAFALSTLFSNILFYYLTVRKFKPPEEPALDTLRFGRHLTYINLMGPLVGQLDSIILNHFFGPAALAVYSIATAIPNRAIPFIKDFVDLGFPKVAVKTPKEINKAFYKRIAQGLLVGGLFAGAYALIAPYLFTYLMPQYLDAVFFTQLLALNFIFAMPNRYVTVLLNSQRMSRKIFATNFIQNIMRFATYLVLGILGGILGLVIAHIFNSFIGLLINIATWRFPKRHVLLKKETS